MLTVLTKLTLFFYWSLYFLLYLPRNPPRTSRYLPTSTTFFLWQNANLTGLRHDLTRKTLVAYSLVQGAHYTKWRNASTLAHKPPRLGREELISSNEEVKRRINKLFTATLPTAKVNTYRKTRVSKNNLKKSKYSVKLLKLKKKRTSSDGRKAVLSSTRLSGWKRRHYICIDTAGGRRLHRV